MSHNASRLICWQYFFEPIDGTLLLRNISRAITDRPISREDYKNSKENHIRWWVPSQLANIFGRHNHFFILLFL